MFACDCNQTVICSDCQFFFFFFSEPRFITALLQRDIWLNGGILTNVSFKSICAKFGNQILLSITCSVKVMTSLTMTPQAEGTVNCCSLALFYSKFKYRCVAYNQEDEDVYLKCCLLIVYILDK